MATVGQLITDNTCNCNLYRNKSQQESNCNRNCNEIKNYVPKQKKLTGTKNRVCQKQGLCSPEAISCITEAYSIRHYRPGL
eukprot:649871-Amphidinium_carterae.1